MFIKVDLPEPEGPMMDTNSPRWMSKEMPFNTCTGIWPSR